MQIFRSFEIPEDFLNSVIAIGNFDGVHLGHQAVLNKAKEIGLEKKIGVLTFEPHPKCFFNKEFDFFRLTPFREKYRILNQFGIDFMINIKFDEKFLKKSAFEFISENLVNDLGVNTVVTGFDFVFGNKKVGDVNYINNFVKKTKKFQFFEVPEVKNNRGIEVSSSNIREFIRVGEVESANLLLTRKWKITGRVIRGEKKAREIGFKTANIKVNGYCNLKYGVYQVSIELPKKLESKVFFGIANFGIKPTFNKSEPLLEVHLFDFNKEIYNERLEVTFHKFIRPEKKFESIVKLKDQIIKDINQVKNDRLFKNN